MAALGGRGIAGPHRQSRPHAAGTSRVEPARRIRHEHDGLRCDPQAARRCAYNSRARLSARWSYRNTRSSTASDCQPRNAGRAAAGRGSNPTRKSRRDDVRRASATGPPPRRERPRRRIAPRVSLFPDASLQLLEPRRLAIAVHEPGDVGLDGLDAEDRGSLPPFRHVRVQSTVGVWSARSPSHRDSCADGPRCRPDSDGRGDARTETAPR